MSTTLLKALGLLGLFSGLFVCVTAGYARAEAPLLRHRLRYVRHLESLLRPLGVKASGQRLFFLQLGLVFAALVFGVGLALPAWLSSLLLVAPVLGPLVVLQRKNRQRSLALDQSMPDFMLAFANALRVTPSIGAALQQVSELQTGPMADELRLAVQEMRIGASVEQALYNMAARMKSVYADSALAGVLIGRQVGGNIPEILESTAETIRELERLHGVLRVKTAEAKGQTYVMAGAPPVVGLCYELLNPGHFDPFFASRGGMMLLAGAVVLWAAGLLIARSMLKVDF